MKERPILFSGPMVRAILEGRKTQTRRLVKSRHIRNGGDPGDVDVLSRLERHCGSVVDSDCFGVSFDNDGIGGVVSVPMNCPFGEPGDRLWVRETWQPIWAEHRERRSSIDSPEGWNINYAADGVIEYHDDEHGLTTRCKPGIHMPRWASRITLEVTGVRVERLHAITGRDVLAEGVDNGKSNPTQGERWENMQRLAFADLWSKINGAESWDANPFVWVISFRRIDAAARNS